MSRIFISYATSDGAPEAHQLVDALEAAGSRCWIAPRDVRPGGLIYPDQRVTAILESRGLVLLLTPGANESRDVLRELQSAFNEGKLIVPVIVRGTRPSDGLSYFLARRQQIVWTDTKAAAAVAKVLADGDLDAEGRPRREMHLEATRLALGSNRALRAPTRGTLDHGAEAPAAPQVAQPAAAAQKSTAPSRAYGRAAIVVGALGLAIGGFALIPRTGHHQRELLAGIRGTWAPEKQGCGGHGAVKYDFAGDEKEVTISQGDELIGRVVSAQAGAIIVYRTVGGVREQWEFEPDSDHLHVTHGRTETILVRCGPKP
jgi:hypothetical protein